MDDKNRRRKIQFEIKFISLLKIISVNKTDRPENYHKIHKSNRKIKNNSYLFEFDEYDQQILIY